MYLSEITIREEAFAKRFLPRDNYGWHKMIWRFFPNRETETRQFVFRVDPLLRAWRIYVVSPYPAHAPERLPDGVFRCREIPDSFFSHTDYLFSLRANPTRRIHTDKRAPDRICEKGIRVPITDWDELKDWLQRKGEQGGFMIPSSEDSLSILCEGRQHFHKSGFQPAHHSSVLFQGHLHVTEPILFRETFRNGIGSAKSFGFGLLLLQPLP